MYLNATEVTYGRALKIWWSYLWRAMVLMIPVMIVAMVISISILPFPKPGQPAPAFQPGMFGKAFIVWLLIMTLNIAVQVQAMRWMLKTKWSGFRLQAIADD